MKKHFTAYVIFAATALAHQQVWALGFGRAVSDAVLGQALTFMVPVHVEAGERLGADCVSADVYYGESRLAPSAVRTSVERGTSDNDWLVRITAQTPIAEPVVEVALGAGCERRFVRRFTVFADPPTLNDAVPPAALADMAGQAGGPTEAAAVAGNAPVAGVRPARRAGNGAPVARTRAHRANAGFAQPAAAAPLAASGAARHPGERARKPAGALASAPIDGARLVLEAPLSHLKLDMEEPIVPSAVASSASGAAIVLGELDDPNAQRLRALEQSIAAIRRDGLATREQATRLQAQLAQAQSRSDWLPYVLALLGAALAAVAALAWKLRQQPREQHSAWFAESQMHAQELPPSEPPAQQVSPAPYDGGATGPTTAGGLLDEPVAEAGFAPPKSLPHPRLPADSAATLPLDRGALGALMAQEAAPARELSVEELIDLEQQADFFIALGQEDAAVELLMAHLRSAGGQSPLPYTKLLEIYRRHGDRSAYERTRARFNRRFNAYAPDWDTGPGAGRTLEDYPQTVARVQQAWNAPIDAMAVLEGLLFKRDDTSELFDLPAYRDVLVL